MMEIEGEAEAIRDEATSVRAAEADIESEQLVAKPSAQVWKHFGFEADDSGRPRQLCRPQCRVCLT